MSERSMREKNGFWLFALVLCAFAAHGDVLRSVREDVLLPVHETTITFADLGSGTMALQGAQSTAVLHIGTRNDQAVVGATLHLRLTYSPALLPELSHLRISVNGQVVAALPLPKADAGHEVEREVVLDPRYFSDYNEIRFDLIAHYSLECEDPQHSSLWASLSPSSDLTLTTRPIDLRDELAFLPVPFFDRRDNRPLVLPMLFAAPASRETLRSAGIAASWFGMLADYRGARFPVSFDALPAQHALVFATNDSRPRQLNLPTVDVPTLSIVDNPGDQHVKLLVFQGKDETQLRQAVEGLVLGNAVLTGTSATITEVAHVRRAAYDVPRWLSTERAVKFGELVDSPGQLQAAGIAPPPITINLRLPPDLFTWNRSGVPIDLHYRYTAPNERDNSLLTVTVNDQLLRSYRLTPEAQSGGDGRFDVPLLQSDSSRQTRSLVIPAFELASVNQIQFQFAMEYHRQGLCREVFMDDSREAIDPDSTIDISSFPHYAALPNLALFADAGYPFTRFADLGETAVVLPDAADPVAIEQLFFVLGRFGRQTGAVSLAYRLLDTQQALTAANLDLLILSGPKSNELLAHWGQNLALRFDDGQRRYRDTGGPANSRAGWTRPDARTTEPAADVALRASGSLGALLSFESPVSSGRTVVALVGSDDRAAAAVSAALGDDSKLPLIRGDLTLVRDGDLQSREGSHVYFVGSLSWWQWLWFHFSRHALLLTLVCLATAVAAALLIYGVLQRLAARRLAPRATE
jgi:hypothetical protein